MKKLLALLLLLPAISWGASVAPVFVASCSDGDTNCDIDVSTGVGDNRNRLLVACFVDETTSTGYLLSSVTVGGTAMVQLANRTLGAGPGAHLECYSADETQLSGKTGTQTITAAGGDADWGIAAGLWDTVANDTVFEISGTHSSTATVLTRTNVDNALNGLVMWFGASTDGTTTFSSYVSPRSSMTEHIEANGIPGNGTGFSASERAGPAAVDQTYSVTLDSGPLRATAYVFSWTPQSDATGTVDCTGGSTCPGDAHPAWVSPVTSADEYVCIFDAGSGTVNDSGVVSLDGASGTVVCDIWDTTASAWLGAVSQEYTAPASGSGSCPAVVKAVVRPVVAQPNKQPNCAHYD